MINSVTKLYTAGAVMAIAKLEKTSLRKCLLNGVLMLPNVVEGHEEKTF